MDGSFFAAVAKDWSTRHDESKPDIQLGEAAIRLVQAHYQRTPRYNQGLQLTQAQARIKELERELVSERAAAVAAGRQQTSKASNSKRDSKMAVAICYKEENLRLLSWLKQSENPAQFYMNRLSTLQSQLRNRISRNEHQPPQ